MQKLNHPRLKYCDNNRTWYLLETITWIIIILLCYTTIIIFYSLPFLFDMLGKPAQDTGPGLLIGLPCVLTILLVPIFRSPLDAFKWCVEKCRPGNGTSFPNNIVTDVQGLIPGQFSSSGLQDNHRNVQEDEKWKYIKTTRCSHIFISLSMYILTIVLSNILTLVAFRFVTQMPTILIIPFISNMLSMIIAIIFLTLTKSPEGVALPQNPNQPC
jgi:hypothetical protein